MVTSIVPSVRPIVQFVRIINKVSPTINTNKNTLPNISCESASTGLIIPASPRTPSKLKRSLPIKFQTAMP